MTGKAARSVPLRARLEEHEHVVLRYSMSSVRLIPSAAKRRFVNRPSRNHLVAASIVAETAALLFLDGAHRRAATAD
jgi:hypothetical protein